MEFKKFLMSVYAYNTDKLQYNIAVVYDKALQSFMTRPFTHVI